MEGLFDALVTVDKRLPKQQQLKGRSFGVVVLRAKSNRLADLLPLVPALLDALGAIQAGGIKEVGAARGP